jgi:hypothetical protein
LAERDLDDVTSLQAHPNIRTAAQLLDVSPSTLSRRKDLAAHPRGDRDRVLSPKEVLRLAAIYRKRSLNDVAQDLIDHARQASATEAARVEEEVEEFFEQRAVSDERRDEFLALARQLLPASLYEEIEATLAERGAALPDALVGDLPLPRS